MADGLGRVFLGVTYDEDTDRVTAQRHGTAEQVYQFAYPQGGGTISMTDRRGQGVHLATRDATGHLISGSFDQPGAAPLGWTRTYNADGELIAIQRPATLDEWTYDSANPDPLRRGDRLEHRKVADPANLVESWTYLSGVSWSAPKTFTNARGNTTTYFYDVEEATFGDLNGDGIVNQAAGNLVKIQYPTVTLGVPAPQTIVEKSQHDATGRLLRTIDPNGAETAYEYFTAGAAAGYLERSIVDPAGLHLTTSWTVDAVGNILTTTNPRGATTTYERDRLNQITRISGPLGYVTDMTYQGRLLMQRRVKNVNGDGVQDPALPWLTTDMTYTLLGDVATETRSVTAALTATTTYTYDAEQNLVETLYPSGRQDAFEVDARRLVTRVRQGLGVASPVERTYAYDANGARMVEAWSNGMSQTWSDGFGRPNVQRGGNHQTNTEYPPPDDPMPGDEGPCETSCCGAGDPADASPLPVVGAWAPPPSRVYSGLATPCVVGMDGILEDETTDRDELGRPYCDHRMHKDSTGAGIAGGDWFQRWAHDPGGRKTQHTPGAGVPTNFTYDPRGGMTGLSDRQSPGNETTLTLDAAGNPTRTVRSTYNSVTGLDETVTEDRVYDAYDRVTSVTADPGGLSLTSTLKYDSRGNVVEATDPHGNKVKRTFNGLGNATSIVYEPVGSPAITLTMAYNLDGRMTSLTDGMGHTTSYVLDAMGRVVRTDYADGTHEDLVYDAAGRVQQRTDANGTVVVTTYNSVGQPVLRIITRAPGVLGALWESYAYDGLDRPSVAAGEFGNTEFKYTSLSEVESTTSTAIGEPLSPQPPFPPRSLPPATTTYTFDAGGRRSGMTYPNGRTVTYTWDDRSRLSEVVEGGTSLVQFAWSGGDLVRRTYGNGVVLNVTRDALRRPTEWRHEAGGGAVPAGFGYAYDELGQRKYRSRLHDGAGAAYRYDGLGQLTGVKEGVPVADLGPTHVYGDYGTFAAQRQYDFDAAGNRKTVDTTGVLQYYNYVNGVNVPDLMNRYRTIDAGTRVHDANGNVKDDGTFTYAYNYRNQLVSAVRKSDNKMVTRCFYDALGRRVRKDRFTNGVHVGFAEYGYDGSDIIAERDEYAVFTATYVNGAGIDQPLTFDRALAGGGTARYFYHDDALGSVCLVTDGAGANVERYDYSEYGMPTVSAWDPQAGGGAGAWAAGVVGGASGVGNTRMFTGREWDAEIGLYYYRARHYDPASGRFLSPDPIGHRGDSLKNTYRHVGNAPVKYSDPLGLRRTLISWPDGGPVDGAHLTTTAEIRINRTMEAVPLDIAIALTVRYSGDGGKSSAGFDLSPESILVTQNSLFPGSFFEPNDGELNGVEYRVDPLIDMQYGIRLGRASFQLQSYPGFMRAAVVTISIDIDADDLLLVAGRISAHIDDTQSRESWDDMFGAPCREARDADRFPRGFSLETSITVDSLYQDAYDAHATHIEDAGQ
ncbi:MAG: hypothetical protein HZA54_00825 [Planctomycetes bacterium]|nr:hypothetical protein [Planctomycetota bacterium]